MSLAGMIAGRLPPFAELLEAPQFQDLFDPKTVSSRPPHVFDQGLIAALHQLPAPPDGIRYLLIDALDEALTLCDGQLNIVTQLSTRLERFPAWLRVVATTRGEPDVLNKLSGLRAASIDAHRQDNLDDIDRFIEARLQTPNLAERLAASRVPLATVQRKLRNKADGNFLYVSQAMQDIERDNYSFSRLDELPQGLNQWYEAWFARKFPNPKVDFLDARKLLEVILAAREPLPLELISEASGLDSEYEVPSQLRNLSSLLVARDGHYSTFHKSLSDWLAHDPIENKYFTSQKNGHKRMAATGWNLFTRSLASVADYFVSHLKDHLCEVGQWQRAEEFLEARIRATDPCNDPFLKFSEVHENLKLELVELRHQLGVQRRYHPMQANYLHTLGAQGDYCDVFQFPCCGAVVVTGKKSPNQYQPDGCRQDFDCSEDYQ